MKGVLSFLLVLLCIAYISALTIDSYAENTGTTTQTKFCACETANSTCYIGSNQNVAIGAHRAEILLPVVNPGFYWQDGCAGIDQTDYGQYCLSGLNAQTGCPATGCVGNYGSGGQLGLSTPPSSIVVYYNIWDGGCPTTFGQINYSGLGGRDLSDGGTSDSFNINIGKVDLEAKLTVYVWSDATRGSFASFNPQDFGRSANSGLAYTRVALGFLSAFQTIGNLSGPADFRNVGAIALEIDGNDSLDLIIALIETAGVLDLKKYANITTDTTPAGIANTGDVVTFNLTLTYNGLGNPVGNVYLWDDPSVNYKVNPANYFPYYSLVPGSLIVATYNVDPVSGDYSAVNLTYTEVNGPNVQANLGRIVLFLGNVSQYTAYNVFFAIRIPSTLPCCLPTCRAACTSGTGGESCYCIANLAYYCEQADGINLVAPDASGNLPNFNTAFVDNNCGYSTVPQSGRLGSASVTTPQITVTPVYAPSSPYVVFSSPAPPASVAPGAAVCATFTVGNNGTRDTAAVVTLSFNSGLLTSTATGSSAGFTCSASSCVSALNSYVSGSSISYTLCFTANALSTCTSATAQFTASIAPNGCSSTSITGPIAETNATVINGSVAVGACIDVNSADNTATSSSTSITGSAIQTISANFTSTTIAPSGQTTLTVCASNTGNVPATNSIITVTIPSGASASGNSWTISGTTATYSLGTVNGATTCAPVSSLVITYTASVLTCTNAVLNFPVVYSSDCGTVNTSLSLTPTGNTAISLVKTADATSYAVGGVITYTLTYTNNGTRQYDTVTLTDIVPVNTVYTGSNGFTCSPNNNAGSVCTSTIAATAGPQTFQVTISSNLTCADTSVNNTATAQGYCAGPPVSFQTNIVSASVPVTITGAPDFYVTKVATDGNGNTITGVQAGGSVTYVISYGNRGNRVSGAVITEAAVGSPFSFVGPNTWSSADANGARTLSVANVFPGQTGSVTFVVQSAGTAASCANVSVPNTVSIAAVAPCVENNLADNTATATVSVAASVDLYIYFVPLPSFYLVPGNTTGSLQFCYGNQGNSGTTNAIMTVNLPSGITAASTGNSGFTVSTSGTSVTYAIGAVTANQAVQCRTLFVNLPATTNCTDQPFNSTATISSDCAESNTTNNQTPYSLGITSVFDLFITKTQPSNATITQVSPQVTYCINYGNNGGKTVTPVVITEFVPVNTNFVSSASDSRWVQQSTGVYTLNLGSVSAGFASSSCIAFTVTSNLPISALATQSCNSVSISNNGVCGNEVTLANNNASVCTPIVGNPDVFVQKTANGASFFGAGAITSGNVSFGQNAVVYTISYGNNGDADAQNVTITESVPQNTVYDSAHSASGWSCVDGAAALTTCTANVGRVPIAANRAQGVVYGSLAFAVRATSVVGATLTPCIACNQPPTPNYVSIAVASPQVDLNQANNQANASVSFGGLPNLYTSISVDSTVVRVAGDVAIFTINYGNNGVKQATNAVLSVNVPEYTIFNAAQSSSGFVPSGNGVAGSNVTFSLGNLVCGATGSVRFAVTVQSGFPASATFTQACAEVANNCQGGVEVQLTDNTACAQFNITGYFDLVLQKHGYCESILFTMNYENVGTIGARDVFLKTYIPQDATFDANNSAAGWVCNANTPGSECRYEVTTVDPRNANGQLLDYIAPGSGGSVNFAVTPYASSMSSTFTLDSSIDDNFTGDNLDPTPDNNRASTTVGFSGCAACDSCCPEVDQCCPDYTDVNFVFGGVLDGLNTCS